MFKYIIILSIPDFTIQFAEASYAFYENSSATVIILLDSVPQGLTIQCNVTATGDTATGMFII